RGALGAGAGQRRRRLPDGRRWTGRRRRRPPDARAGGHAALGPAPHLEAGDALALAVAGGAPRRGAGLRRSRRLQPLRRPPPACAVLGGGPRAGAAARPPLLRRGARHLEPGPVAAPPRPHLGDGRAPLGHRPVHPVCGGALELVPGRPRAQPRLRQPHRLARPPLHAVGGAHQRAHRRRRGRPPPRPARLRAGPAPGLGAVERAPPARPHRRRGRELLLPAARPRPRGRLVAGGRPMTAAELLALLPPFEAWTQRRAAEAVAAGLAGGQTLVALVHRALDARDRRRADFAAAAGGSLEAAYRAATGADPDRRARRALAAGRLDRAALGERVARELARLEAEALVAFRAACALELRTELTLALDGAAERLAAEPGWRLARAGLEALAER